HTRSKRDWSSDVCSSDLVDSGDRIRLSGQGAAGAQGGGAGDLYVDVQVRPHPLFRRDGDDLLSEVPITISTAALGGQLKVPTLRSEERRVGQGGGGPEAS